MAIVVEDGSGLSNSNSYISVADADTYLTYNDHIIATWTALSTTEKENALIRATMYLDRYMNWNGYKVNSENALRWPRSNVKDLDGFYFSISEIPEQVQRAVAELGYLLSQSDLDDDPASKGISEVTVDVIRVKFDKTDRSGPVPSAIRSMLRGLGDCSVGSRFKKVVRS